jgi:putative ABC transport system ATP-binding protein
MAALEISDLKKHYPLPGGGQHLVLDLPAFSLGAGEQAALEGPSGSGKTTLLHCCAGILRPSAGAVRVGGVELGRLSEGALDAARGRLLGYVFQTFNLLQGLSALENVALAMRFGAGLDEARALGLLDRVGLADKAGHRPGQLSVGQQQRVAVARALANRPQLVLADEPTGNLDAAAGQEALALLRQACRETGAALLLVSHDPAVLRRFSRRHRLTQLNRAAHGATLAPRPGKAAKAAPGGGAVKGVGR